MAVFTDGPMRPWLRRKYIARPDPRSATKLLPDRNSPVLWVVPSENSRLGTLKPASNFKSSLSSPLDLQALSLEAQSALGVPQRHDHRSHRGSRRSDLNCKRFVGHFSRWLAIS
jgi:hypothetical protein